jgi:hypothetical protein
MFTTKKNSVVTAVNAALLVALLSSAPAFANASGATLAQNESAAQHAIVETPNVNRPAQASSGVLESSATLAHNEEAAQQAISAAAPINNGGNIASGRSGQAALVYNELAARRAIENAPTYGRFMSAGRDSKDLGHEPAAVGTTVPSE